MPCVTNIDMSLFTFWLQVIAFFTAANFVLNVVHTVMRLRKAAE